MSTLLSTKLQSNSNISISADGGLLTNDAGISLIFEFFHKIKLDCLIASTMNIIDPRKFCRASFNEILTQKSPSEHCRLFE
ncbi:hypothetical protein ACFQAV_08835 [Companilactobacillus huachuanensis]|uniref:Transposase DDE domain-containing protein n=1 Tax=Companilactobacillus huachuanensis TaxID=2559914 RepID=A0ABW1RPL5_9LACO|nr:transposase [Companilactobacillus huachuanensis]